MVQQRESDCSDGGLSAIDLGSVRSSERRQQAQSACFSLRRAVVLTAAGHGTAPPARPYPQTRLLSNRVRRFGACQVRDIPNRCRYDRNSR